MLFSNNKEDQQFEFIEAIASSTILKGLEGVKFSFQDISVLMAAIECQVLQCLADNLDLSTDYIKAYFDYESERQQIAVDSLLNRLKEEK